MLDQVVEMMGDEKLTIETFANLLDKGFEGMKLAMVPPALDQVFIGSIERSRAANVKLLFVLGVNDGVFPSRMQEEGVFTEREREKLQESGLELAPSLRRRLMDEQFLIYTVLTMPSEKLWLSYPVADEEGKSLLPSEIIRRLLKWFPELSVSTILTDPKAELSSDEQLKYIQQGKAAVSYTITQLQQWLKGEAIDPLWWELYHWICEHPKWKQRLKSLTGSLFYINQERPLDKAQSRLLYGEDLQVSVSRMEKYTACPFSQFISHGLRLKDRKMFRLEAPDIGQLFHAALNQMVVQVVESRKDWVHITDEDCRSLAVQTVEQLAPSLQNEILLSSKRHQYIAGKLRDTVSQAFRILKNHALRSDFKPIGLEFAFGPGQKVPSLVFPLDNGTHLEVVGRIDRIDRADSDKGPLLRVIDYKSSETHLNLNELYYGLSLQMLTYLDVVLTHSEQWLGSSARPAGVLYFHVHHPIMQTKNGLAPDKAEEAMLKKFKMKGLVDADQTTVKLMDKQLDKGHSTLIPVGLKTDGSFYSNSSVATEVEWDLLRRYVRSTIQSIGTRLTEGHVEIDPYRLAKKIPCTFCDYKSICQFDVMVEGNAYHQLRPMNKQQVFDAIEQNRGEFKVIQ
jgi:ATP-dependent helicase/nuclease subunit B